MQSRPPRPAGITIIAIMVILGGVIGLLVSLAILGFSALLATVGATSIGSIGAIIGGVFLFFSLLWLAVGIGFLSGKGCAWTLGMIVTVLSLLGSVSAIGVGQSGGVLGLVFWGLLIYYLTRPRVKTFFGKGGMPITPIYPLTPQYGQPAMTTNYPGFGQPQTTTSIPSYAQPPANPPTLTFNPLPAGTSTPVSQIGPNSSPSMVQAIVSCPNCGSRLAIGQNKCFACGASI